MMWDASLQCLCVYNIGQGPGQDIPAVEWEGWVYTVPGNGQLAQTHADQVSVHIRQRQQVEQSGRHMQL